jgi:molybdopterin-guanine dinucleotide biosynthesis protein A
MSKEMSVPRISVAILAGGQSRRMGQDKAFLPVGGLTVIERVIQRVAGLSDDVVIVTNTPDRYRYLGQRLVSDVYPDTGALGGIYTGIHTARHPYCLVVACDMPFLNTNLLSYLITLTPDSDVVIPVVKEFPETMHALYGKGCLGPIEVRLQARALKIIGFFDDVRVRYVQREEVARFDPAFRSFMNMNTPADWQTVQHLASEE